MKDKKAFWLVAALIVVHATLNWIWLRRDTLPLWFDYAGYFDRSLQNYAAFQSGFVDFLLTVVGVAQNGAAFLPHRLFLPLSSVPWYFVFGPDTDVAVMGCTVFFATVLFSVYGMATKLFDRRVGFWSAFILSTSMGFFVFYRRYSPEFASASLLALSFYFYLMSENFQKRSYSVLTGVALGLAMLTKELPLAYVPGVAVYGLYSFFADKDHRRGSLLNGGIFLLVFCATVLPVYWIHRQVFLSRFFTIYSGEVAKAYELPQGSFQGLLYYLKTISDGFQPFYMVLSFLGLLMCFWNKVRSKGLLLTWFLISLAILSSTKVRAEYYAIPLLIPLSVYAGYAVEGVFKAPVAFLKVFVVLWGLLNVLNYSFPETNFKQLRIFKNPKGYANYYYPIQEDWKLGEISDYLKENIPDAGRTPRVHIGANSYPFSAMTMIYTATLRNLKAEFFGYNVPKDQVFSCDFVVVKSGEDQGLLYPPEQAKELVRDLEKSSNFVQLSRTFTMPDRSVVRIFKRK